MNANRLLAHYEKIAGAPDAIARLRRFILDLAVRGKLVPQDPNDEPASELLKRIAKEKVRAGKREKVEAEIDNEEELGELPPTWRAVPLIALGSWAIGTGFPKNEQGLESGPHFFLKVSDMNLPGNDKYVTTSSNFIDDDAARRMRAKIHPPGTIIFPKIGGAIATNKRRILTKGSAIDNNCLGITFAGELNVEWAFLLLTTIDFTRYQAGTAVPALQQGVLERIPVGLPPLAEQHRIVAKVDELMGLCDRLDTARASREGVRDRLAAASLARLNAPDPKTFQADARFVLDALPALTTRPDQIKALRQTILNLAVRGKLVPQDATDEPTSELLKRVAKEKAQLVKAGKIRKEKAIPDLSSGDLPFESSSGWEWVRLEHLAHKITDGEHLSPNKTASGMPLLTAVHVSAKGLTLTNPQFVSIEDGKKYRLRCDPRRGDVLICSRGTIGRCAVVDVDDIFCLMGSVIQVRLPRECSPSYFNYFLSTDRAQRQMRGMSGATAVQALYLKDIQLCPIPVPPLAEQRRIVAKVDALMALCDQLEASLTSTAATRRGLLDALLAEALAPADDREREAAE